MKKLGQFLFLLILTANLSAFEITAMEKGEMIDSVDGSFPVLKETSQAAKKINSHMQLEVLNLKIGHHKKSIYEAFPWGTAIEGHKIWENSPQILSISIHQMRCGASCSYYDYYYNFDAKRGVLFSVDDIFTATGWQSITRNLLAQWDKAVAKFLKVDKFPPAENPSKESNNLEERGGISSEKMFMNCRSRLSFERFYIAKDALHFPYFGCIGKRDELEFDGVIPINQLMTQLTEFGQQILQPVNTIPNLSSKLLHGTIAGKYPITLIITSLYEYENIYHLDGYYWYDKYGIGIRLDGELKNKQLTLTETDKNYENVAIIKGTMTQAGIKGTWQSIKRRKKLSFEVSP